MTRSAQSTMRSVVRVTPASCATSPEHHGDGPRVVGHHELARRQRAHARQPLARTRQAQPELALDLVGVEREHRHAGLGDRDRERVVDQVLALEAAVAQALEGDRARPACGRCRGRCRPGARTRGRPRARRPGACARPWRRCSGRRARAGAASPPAESAAGAPRAARGRAAARGTRSASSASTQPSGRARAPSARSALALRAQLVLGEVAELGVRHPAAGAREHRGRAAADAVEVRDRAVLVDRRPAGASRAPAPAPRTWSRSLCVKNTVAKFTPGERRPACARCGRPAGSSRRRGRR